jgi:hypothetical protein
VLGKPIAYVRTKSATSAVPPHARDSSMLRVIGRSARLLGTWWITGAGSPSPFFDDKTHAPRVTPRILGVKERVGIYGRSPSPPER